MEPRKIPPKKTISDREYYLFALRIVGDFGGVIAVPVVVLVLLGRYLDKYFSTGHTLTIIGFMVAFVISSVGVYQKAKQFGQEFQKLK
jgi:F0F1-type ATP synthase assembly protein I